MPARPAGWNPEAMPMTAEHDPAIAIEVEPTYLASNSEPEQDRYVFAYTITIHNHSRETVQLRARHWVITDSNGRVEEVHGEGVVGEQPVIGPGERYRYTSGAVLATPVGTMEGRYDMETGIGEHFQAAIPRFTLSVPRTLH